jgi:iron complex transport system substrate-binding protein
MRRLVPLIPVILLLAACTQAPADPEPAVEPIVNCGYTVDPNTTPQRVVTIKSTSTEMLVALGLGDRIIGTAFQDGPLPTDLAGAGATIPVIAEKVPSEEALLAVDPDFVYAGWESNLTAESAGDRDELASLGIGSYVSPSACKEAPFKPTQLGYDDIFTEISQAGRIFAVRSAAGHLVAQQKELLSSIVADDRGLTALWWSSGTDTPYVGAGTGAPALTMTTLGLTNIAGDVDDTWTSLGWEAIVAADPDVIVLVDASWNTAASKREFLENDPATKNLTAVKNGAFLVIPFAASEAGVSTIPATADLATQLAALR